MIKEAIIPLAGLGTRLLPFSKILPKELLPLGNKTILEHILDECLEAGIKKIILVISNRKEVIKDYFFPDHYLLNYLKKKNDNKSIQKLRILDRYKIKLNLFIKILQKVLEMLYWQPNQQSKINFFFWFYQTILLLKKTVQKK